MLFSIKLIFPKDALKIFLAIDVIGCIAEVTNPAFLKIFSQVPLVPLGLIKLVSHEVEVHKSGSESLHLIAIVLQRGFNLPLRINQVKSTIRCEVWAIGLAQVQSQPTTIRLVKVPLGLAPLVASFSSRDACSLVLCHFENQKVVSVSNANCVILPVVVVAPVLRQIIRFWKRWS